MSDFGQTQTSNATLGGNSVDIPVNSVVPDGTITPVAVAGGPSFTDTGKARAPVSLYVKDGNDTTQGAKADSAATDSTGTWSVVALLKGILAKLLGTLSVSGAVTTSGTVTEANSAAIKTDLDTLAGAVSGGKAAVKAASGDVADGAINTLGAQADAAWSLSGNATMIALMKKLDLLLQNVAYDNTNELKTSLYGKNAAAGDTPIKLNSAGSQYFLGDFIEYTGLSAGALNADLVATLDVSTSKSMGLQINGNAFVGTLSFRWSDDGVNFYPLLLWRKDTSSVGSASLSTTSNAQGWYGNLACHYLQIRMTSYTSGAAQATLDLFTQPVAVPVGNIAQSGTWTMQPGNTQNTTPWLTQGPTATATQAANSASNTVIKGSPGTLWTATVTTLGTAGLDIFDNASTNAGVKLLSIPASAPVGTIYAFPAGQPAANGIVSAGVLNCPAVTFSIR